MFSEAGNVRSTASNIDADLSAGIARDLAGRGWRVLLAEAEDLAQHTSSSSTKLIHGGVRYLAQGRLGLVREALAERATLLATAPHLVHPQRFVVPVYRQWDRLVLAAGLTAYDWLAGARSLGPSRLLSVDDTLAALPGVSGVPVALPTWSV